MKVLMSMTLNQFLIFTGIYHWNCNSQKVTSGISLQWSTKSSDIYNNLASAINDYDVWKMLQFCHRWCSVNGRSQNWAGWYNKE